MSVVYRDVLERFVKYREQRNISQNELAQMLCIYKVMSVKWKWERQESHLIF